MSESVKEAETNCNSYNRKTWHVLSNGHLLTSICRYQLVLVQKLNQIVNINETDNSIYTTKRRAQFGVSGTFTKMLLVGPLEETFSNLLERWFALGR